MPLLAFAGLALAVFIFTGGFASARLYMEASGRPADVVALRYGISGLLFVSFVYRRAIGSRQIRDGGALQLSRLAAAHRLAFVYLSVSAAPRLPMGAELYRGSRWCLAPYSRGGFRVKRWTAGA